ncbi:Neurotrophin-3 [Anabarilius grahami]|uniref:Neurotrophin-3 n=1 Tax=Anabarilius grahami TaxID=495550 RepID=A0A3N0Z243_ANAGA|nr:Neurotrophin-3 [Anabarilius grahami]
MKKIICSTLVLSFQVLQVNLVMSILLYVMFLAYLYGISASTMDKQRPTQDPINTLIIKLLQADISRSRQKQDEGALDALPSNTLNTPAVTDYKEKVSSTAYHPVTDISSELLRQHKRYNSPRVLLSERPPLQPPPLYLTNDFVSNQEGNKTRQKRYAEHKSYRAEYSVCDSISQWVTDRTTAMDIEGLQVTILGTVNTGRKNIKQYFYETKCETAKHHKSGCRGIDGKHWNSQCKTSQSFVRALTQYKSLCMRNLCKEEDYTFLNSLGKQDKSPESTCLESECQEKQEERIRRRLEREQLQQEMQREIEEQQKVC